jgi:hypothetical protein
MTALLTCAYARVEVVYRACEHGVTWAGSPWCAALHLARMA